MDTIDEQIAKLQMRLDQLRNTDYVEERKRRIYYRSIAEAEAELARLSKLKEES